MDKKRDIIKKEKDNEYVVRVMYRLCVVALIPIVILFFILRTDYARQALLFSGYDCAFHNATGLACPGCGGTRAAILLANLSITDSFRMHASVLTGAVLYVFFVVTEFFHFRFGKKGLREGQLYALIWIFVIVLIARWILLLTGIISI